MGKRNFKIVVIFILLLGITYQSSGNEKVYLFTDQNSCVSGDTIWFDILLFDQDSTIESNIVHVELTKKLLPINHTILKCINDWGKGFMVIPDSLSTGVYQILAYTNKQKFASETQIVERSIVVYNRFENDLEKIEVPDFSLLNEVEFENNCFGINLTKELYSAREKIKFTLKVPDELRSKLKGILVTARLADPLADSFPYMNKLISTQKRSSESIVEKNGILVEGIVYDAETQNPALGALVFLTIPDSIPYFDYCVADTKGKFKFYLKNATGIANLVLQVITSEKKDFEIKLGTNNSFSHSKYKLLEKQLTYNEIKHFKKVVDAAFYEKLFGDNYIEKEPYFEMDNKSSYPYYGKPDEVVSPELFIDLPNFTEISRELLSGVYYRRKDNKQSIRMLNMDRMDIFNSEPLKLINGIPIFDINLLKDLGTNQIERIELIHKQKYFGDLVFNGVLAVYTKDQTFSWAENIPKLFNIKYNCVQKYSTNKNLSNSVKRSNSPDFGKVYLNEMYFNLEKPLDVSFTTSDLLGEILIEVIGIGKDNKLYYDIKKAKVE